MIIIVDARFLPHHWNIIFFFKMKGILIGVCRNALHMSYRKTMFFFSPGQISLTYSLANGMVGPGGRVKGRAPDSWKGLFAEIL